MNGLAGQGLLLVDDDEVFRDTLARALTRHKLIVYPAGDSAGALRLALQHRPALGIIDLCLGGESGLEVVARLAADHPAMRLIVLTGFASISTAVEAIKLGAIHYLIKPATAADILDALQKEKGDTRIPATPQPMSVKRLEWEHIQKTLAAHQGNVSAAARALGMHRRTLQRKLQKKPVRQ